MADQAKVTSIDVLESFRVALISFLSESRRSLDEVTDAVRRTRMWLETDQRTHWEGQIRRRQKVLQEAEAELFGAKLSPLREVSAKQQEAVRRARRAVAEAEEKLRNVKKWNRDYDSVVEPMTKRLEGLRYFLDHDMIKALAFLVQAQKTLEGYAEVQLQNPAPAPAEPLPEDAP
ncbi:MAG: hypothetical protein ABMA13_11245 [Chthoniobacteraceae bacterium]